MAEDISEDALVVLTFYAYKERIEKMGEQRYRKACDELLLQGMITKDRKDA